MTCLPVRARPEQPRSSIPARGAAGGVRRDRFSTCLCPRAGQVENLSYDEGARTGAPRRGAIGCGRSSDPPSREVPVPWELIIVPLIAFGVWVLGQIFGENNKPNPNRRERPDGLRPPP